MFAALAARVPVRRVPWPCHACAALCLALAGPATVEAQPEGPTSNGALAQEVVLQLESSAGDDIGALRATLRELLSRLGLVLVTPSEAHEPRVAVRLTIVINERDAQVSVRASAANADSFERDVPRSETTSLFRETLGHVVLGLVEPIALEQRPAPERGPEPGAEPSSEPPAERPRARAPLQLSLSAGTGLVRATTSAPSVLLFAGVTLGSEQERRPGASLRVGGMPRLALAGHGVEADLRLFAARAIAHVVPWHRGRYALSVSLGGGVNVLTMTSHDGSATVLDAHDTLRVQGVLGSLLGVHVQLGKALSLVLQGGLELDPRPRSWYVRRDTEALQFAETPSLLPCITLALDMRVARMHRQESEP